MGDINKIFVYVNDENIKSFKSKYIKYKGEESIEPNKYDNKIVFLGSTGEIFTRSQIYNIIFYYF